MKKILSNFQGGQTLIELLITIGLAAILMPAFLTSFFTTRSGRAQQDQRLQAIAYVREAEEAVRIVRDNNWSNLTTGNFYPSMSGSSWTLVSTTSGETVGSSFTRLITIADAYRDSLHNICAVSSCGTVDPSTKIVTISVSWTSPISSHVTQTIYLTRHDNITAEDILYTDFNSGDTSGGTVVEYYNGSATDGDVQIGGGGSNDWCAPGTPIKKQTSSNHNEYAISAFAGATAGASASAYTTFGDSKNVPALNRWNVSDAATPTITSGGSSSVQEKSYGLFATSSAVFVTSNNSGGNSVTVDVMDPSTLNESAKFVASGGEAGRSVYVGYTKAGVEGFVSSCSYSNKCTGSYNLYAFDYHSAPFSGSRTQDGVASLTAEGTRVVVVKGIAFVATTDTANQLQIFNVWNVSQSNKLSNSNKITFSYGSKYGYGSIQSIQAIAAEGAQGATDIYVDPSGNFAYLVTSYNSKADIFLLDLTDLLTQSKVYVEEIQTTSVSGGGTMSPTGVISVSQNHIVVVGTGGNQYQVFTTYPGITRCVSSNNGMLNIGFNVKAVSSVSEVDGDNFAYILTDDPNNELQVIPGGEGSSGGTGGGKGTFISRVLPVPNLTTATTFNGFYPLASTPSATIISYQVSVAGLSGGVCPTTASSYTFIGPNGTSLSSDTFSTSSAIPVKTTGNYQNPGECFRYKAYFDSNGSTTASPILYDVKVNYSP